MQAESAYTEGMKSIQYTLRDVPESVDRELRSRATRERQSLNSVALNILAVGLGMSGEPPRSHDLDPVAGSWIEDPAFDAALKSMDKVDKALWK